MTKVVDIERIRWAHLREGLSVREVARAFHVSRKTVRKAIADPGPWSYRRTAPTVAPVMGPVVHIVERWLEEDRTAPRKQRHTATRIWERLRAEHGFEGAESTVRQWVREHRPARIRAVTLPLAHDPGAEAQFDFGEAHVRLGGVETTVQLFCGRLAYSTRDVVRAYQQQDRAAWLDGQARAFSWWGGVPATCWYDNPSQLGRFRQGRFIPCQEFIALQSAFGFRAHHCTPGEGHEKGLVEGLVGSFRRRYLVPVPDVADLDELNRLLEDGAAAEERRRRRGHATTVGERFAEEQPLLGPLPERPFLACTRHRVRVSSQQLVTFGPRRYSVPLRWVGQWLTLRAFAEHIEVWSTTSCVARHVRAFGPGEPITDFWHFLPVLVRKPGAFVQAIPVRQACFPDEARALLAALEERHADDRRRAHREFLAACALAADTEPVRWRAACATAVVRGEVSAVGVRAALRGEPRAGLAVAMPAALAGVTVPAGDLAQYGRLLEVTW
jgi:transposase